MQMTRYGQTLARQDGETPDYGTGAMAHAKACAHDSGMRIVLTGKTHDNRPIRREARSVFGAWSMAHAMSGIYNAWHIRDDGTRKLVFCR